MRASEFVRECAKIARRNDGNGKRANAAMRSLVRRSGAVRIAANDRTIGYRLPGGDVACTKHRFFSEESARRELDWITENARHSYVPKRVYQCQWCKGWHLTSMAHA